MTSPNTQRLAGEAIAISDPEAGQTLVFDGNNWINQNAASSGAPQMSGNIRRQELDDLTLATEIVLGGFAFNPELFTGSTIYLVIAGTLTDAGTTAPSLDLRLYDLGEPGTPQAGDLRATVTLSTTDSPQYETTLLTASDAPTTPGSSPNDGTIYDTERLYEIRAELTGDVGDLVEIDWAGIQGGVAELPPLGD
jgi:hypothetical protein